MAAEKNDLPKTLTNSENRSFIVSKKMILPTVLSVPFTGASPSDMPSNCNGLMSDSVISNAATQMYQHVNHIPKENNPRKGHLKNDTSDPDTLEKREKNNKSAAKARDRKIKELSDLETEFFSMCARNQKLLELSRQRTKK